MPPLRYVALGDSYTIGTSVAAVDRWPDRLVAALGTGAEGEGPGLRLAANLALNGSTSTDVLQRQVPRLAGLDPGFASLLVGVNDVIQGVPPERSRANLEAILDALLDRLPADRIVAVTTPDYTVTPAGADYGDPERRRAGIVAVNSVLTAAVGPRGIALVDVFEVSHRNGADPAWTADDGLHPSGLHYASWVERIRPVVRRLLATVDGPAGSTLAPDGSPVEVYRRMPPRREPERIHAAIPPGGTILELGAGAGRVSHALVRLGHPLTAVDASPEMLAGIRGARTVLADIVGLDLAERFDAVVLGSHLVNEADDARRAGFLATCRRHVGPGDVVLIEAYPPDLDWAGLTDRGAGGGVRDDDVAVSVIEATVSGDHLSAAVAYDVPGRRFEQRFEARLLDEAALRAELTASGLAFDGWLDRPSGWLRARRA